MGLDIRLPIGLMFSILGSVADGLRLVRRRGNLPAVAEYQHHQPLVGNVHLGLRSMDVVVGSAQEARVVIGALQAA